MCVWGGGGSYHEEAVPGAAVVGENLTGGQIGGRELIHQVPGKSANLTLACGHEAGALLYLQRPLTLTLTLNDCSRYRTP